METAPGLLRGHDLGALRAKLAREPFAGLFAKLVHAVHAAADQDRQTETLAPGGWCHSLYFTPMVLEAGFIYRMTGDQVALAHVARQIAKLARVYADPPASFLREIPGLKPGKHSAYFSNAHTCLAARLCEPGLDAASAASIRALARQHLIADHHDPRYFFTHWNAGHNAVVTHVIAGAICALLFGDEVGHPDTEQVIEYGRDACEMHVTWGYDAQGAPHEGPMYGLVTLEWVYLYAELLRQHGREDLFQTLPRLAAIAQAASEMQLPGLIGFSGYADCRRLITQQMMPWLLLTARYYQRPQDLALWQATANDPDSKLPHQAQRATRGGVLDLLWWDGALAPTPLPELGLPTAFFGLGATVAVLRSSWRADAVCLYALGQGRSNQVPDHTHADAGHFSLYAYGDYLAYDTGYFNFNEDTHSVVLIDDKPHFPTNRGNQYQGRFAATGRHPLLDFVTVDAASPKGCIWAERHLLFIRGAGDFAYLVVLDKINRDNQIHNYKWQLQANLHCRIELTGPRSASVIGQQARLDCTFVNSLPEDYPTCPHTLKVWADAHEHKAIWGGTPETNPRLVAEQVGCNCTLLAVVVPRRLAEAPIVVTDTTSYRTSAVTVAHGEWVDQIVFAGDHTFVRLPNLRASAEVVVVRRDRQGRVHATWSINGTAVQAKNDPFDQ